MEERRKRNLHIILPQAFTVSMTKSEVAARKAASALFKTIQFKVVEPDNLIPPEHVAGRTIVANEADFETFNEIVKSLLSEDPSSPMG